MTKIGAAPLFATVIGWSGGAFHKLQKPRLDAAEPWIAGPPLGLEHLRLRDGRPLCRVGTADRGVRILDVAVRAIRRALVVAVVERQDASRVALVRVRESSDQ